MSQLGLGVMINRLFGYGGDDFSSYIGKEITKAELSRSDTEYNGEVQSFRLTFTDGTNLSIYDNGQSCCEYRHMSTDDDPNSLVGGKLVSIQEKDGSSEGGPDEDCETYGEVHETAFVEVATDKGFITLVNHNEHNGYYGGFSMVVKVSDAQPSD
jgi:hypothetical protein